MKHLRHCLVLLPLLICATTASAQDGWVQITTPNFIVVSNAGDGRAKELALEFERYRAAIQVGWPWARTLVDRPVVVIAAKDEATMKMLAPQYWEKGSKTQPATVFSTGPDAHFIALRADIRDDDNANSNPHQSAYWAYTSLALVNAFEHPLPLWFRNGFAAVLSNSLVRSDHIDFGRPIDEYLQELHGGVHLAMADFLSVTEKSRDYADGVRRFNFDAQCWAVVHYLLFGRPDTRADAVDQLAKLLLDGKPSADAVKATFGSVEALEQEFILYRQRATYRYARVAAPSTVSASSFVVRRLAAPETTAIRARYHVAMGRFADARALIDPLKAGTPTAGFVDVEAMLLDRDGRSREAFAAYTRAADAGSTNFFTLYRVASFEMQENPSGEGLARIESRLRQSIVSNPTYSRSHVLLAQVLTGQGKAAEAVPIAQRGAVLDQSDVIARVTLARVLWAAGRQADARGQALAARVLADSDEERQAVQSVLDFFQRSTPAAQ